MGGNRDSAKGEASADGLWRNAVSKFPINMAASLNSGQPLAFHSVYKLDDKIAHVSYVTSKGVIELRYPEGKPTSSIAYRYHGGYTAASAGSEVSERFGLGDDMGAIYGKIRTDENINAAVSGLYGMRVTRNEPWETTLCFVISQFNNIKRINGIVRTMIHRYGEVLESGDKATRLFPSPQAISRVSAEELRACGAGFRARYILSIAKACSGELDLESLHRMDYQEAKSLLMSIDGIGDKVADCILLMGYKKLDAFPIDVWIKRSMQRLYFNNRDTSINTIHEFATEKWGKYAGYAQQYLFHHARTRGG